SRHDDSSTQICGHDSCANAGGRPTCEFHSVEKTSRALRLPPRSFSRGALLEILIARSRSKFFLAQISVAVRVDAAEALAQRCVLLCFLSADALIVVSIERFEDAFDFLARPRCRFDR